MSTHTEHTPVLLVETLRLLDARPGETAVDLTVGRGGHSAALAAAVGTPVIGFDLDSESLAHAGRRVRAAGGDLEPIHDNFVRAPHHLRQRGLRADVVLADLGFSSAQMSDPQRGFSFSADGPLDMRYDRQGPVTAQELIARSTEEELAGLIARFGEDPYARKIARKLAQSRQREPIRSTAQLARLVREVYGARARSSRMHPATRTFMALRIAVNDESTALRSLLDQVLEGAQTAREGGWLSPGARVALISFQSLEDRLVKQAFAELAARGLATRLTKRPVTATASEIAANPRSRSAKLRATRISLSPSVPQSLSPSLHP
ncbi:MAG: 16S rRNA (cytosine(1402)-N(4))-methyltransferase RsmH [Planctomycetota bacterium]|jgi:16S rRNA (cytosine1402-N4)-methyltransferase